MEALDIIMIHQLLALYGHIVDANEWDRLDELFVADATLDYTAVSAPDVFEGIEAIRCYFAEANHPSAHHVVNIVVYEVDGKVCVRSKFLAPYTRPTHQPIRWFGGDYNDEVVHRPEGWRFQRRTCTGRWQLSMSGDDPIPPHLRTS